MTHDMNTLGMGGIPFSNISAAEVLNRIKIHVDQPATTPLCVITPNIFHLSLASRNPRLAAVFGRSDISVPDGWPVAAALRIFRGYRYGRITGSDLSLDVLQMAAKESYSVGLLGGSDTSLALAYENVARQYPGLNLVSPVCNPTLPEEPTLTSTKALLYAVNATPVDILLLCLGAPKSEAHLDACRDQMQVKAVLCVGATVDFLSGTVRRAPLWVQRIGFEWAFRLIQEPKRLWRRYMTSAIGFMLIALREIRYLLLRRG